MAKETKTKAQTTQEGAKGGAETKGYRILGEHFKSKKEADNAVMEAHKKGFKSAGLCLKEPDFVLLFGSYDTARQAQANLAAIKTAGFNAEIETASK